MKTMISIPFVRSHRGKNLQLTMKRSVTIRIQRLEDLRQIGLLRMSEFHGELVGGFVGGGFGFGGEIEDEALEDEEFVGRAAAEFEVGAGYKADCAGKFAAGFEGAGEHVEMADGGVFSAVGGVEESVEKQQGAGSVLRADGVGELIEAALLG